jgi:hypothetical protein
MNRISRRSILGAAMAAPFAGFANSFATQATTSTPDSDATNLKYVRLNVIVHGLIGIVFWKKCVEVLPPNVGSVHAYMAGGQGYDELTDLDSGPGAVYWGEFGTRGAYPLKPDGSMFPVASKSIMPDYRQAYCRIVLPVPNSILPLRTIPSNTCGGGPFFPQSNGNIPNPNMLPLAIALVYHQISHRPALRPHPWKPVIKEDANHNRWINLHIRAEPSDPGSGHSLDTYKWLNALFPGLGLTLNEPYHFMGVPVDSPLPLRIEKEDEYTLGELKSGSSSTPKPDCVASRGNLHLLSDRPANCISVGVDNTGS